ncbi:hypothetical protein GCM10010420_35000 [Streptomyces glaucosporus]|uniref:ABC-type Mn/Zn transport systems, ATPase component n=1 Tax=Streptomyces glaucosporus TaxID=284044 RepID=A0ABN3IIQ1_9ACTN
MPQNGLEITVAGRNTLARSLHDLGMGAWFGGSLMGAIGLNGVAREWEDEKTGNRIASIGWAKWTPANGVAIAAHLVGAVSLLASDFYRVGHQRGVGAMSVAKTAVTAAAMGATAYSRVLGKRIEKASSPDPEAPTGSEEHHAAVEDIERQLRWAQWSIPVLTGTLTVISALAGEQQRPTQQKLGMLRKAAERLDLD